MFIDDTNPDKTPSVRKWDTIMQDEKIKQKRTDRVVDIIILDECKKIQKMCR